MFRLGKTDLVKLDFDDCYYPLSLQMLSRVHTVLNDMFGMIGFNEGAGERSPSGMGVHLIFKLGKPVENWRILLCQALCSSDWQRELHNYKRLVNGDPNWNILFSTRREQFRLLRAIAGL